MIAIMFKLHTLLSAIHVQLHAPDLLPETCLVVLPEVQRHSLRLLYKIYMHRCNVGALPFWLAPWPPRHVRVIKAPG